MASAGTLQDSGAGPEDAFVTPGESLQLELDRLFSADTQIAELGFVHRADPSLYGLPPESPENLARKHPSLTHPTHGPAFILIQHNLGIARWAVAPLCRHATTRFAALRREWLDATKDQSSADEARVTEVLQSLVTPILNTTRTLCMVNADHYSSWNMRKRVYGRIPPSEYLTQVLQAELRLMDMIFSHHPKCVEGFSHRRWILNRLCGAAEGLGREIANTLTLQSCSAALFLREWKICDRTAELHYRNYYSWTHRQWLISKLRTCSDLLERLEHLRTTWNDRNISDYSGLFCRQQLIRHALTKLPAHQGLFHPATFISSISLRTLSEHAVTFIPRGSSPQCGSCLGCDVLQAEWRYTLNLIQLYGDHPGLWLHLRFVWLCRWQSWLQHCLSAEAAEASSDQLLKIFLEARVTLLDLAEKHFSDAYQQVDTTDPSGESLGAGQADAEGKSANQGFLYGKALEERETLAKRFCSEVIQEALGWIGDDPELAPHIEQWQQRSLELSVHHRPMD